MNQLESSVHENIFKILIKGDNNIPYSSNSNLTFIDVDRISHELLFKIETFVNEYNEHMKYSNERKIFYAKAQETVDFILDNDYTLDKITEKISN